MSALPSVQGSSRPPQHANHRAHTTVDGSKEIKGKDFTPAANSNSSREIKAQLRRAVKSITKKQAATFADVTEETVKGWRRGDHAPQLVPAIKLARHVAQIENALIELMREGKLNPAPEKPIAIVLSALVEIANERGKVGAKARRALARFNDARGRA